MAIKTCEKCGEQNSKLENCNYCKRFICYGCVKSQKKVKKIHNFICKNCWSNMKSRKKFKSA